MLAGDLYITEFAASNDTLVDSFGDTPDWIELFNGGTDSLDLGDYFLTDDAGELDKWQLPSQNLEPGQFELVFASGRDTMVGSEIHANFKLAAEGGYIGLVESDGTTVKQDFGASYPPQSDRATYGLSMEQVGPDQTLLTSGANASYWVPTNGSLGNTWTDPDFDDSSWSTGPTAVGYENSPADYQNIITTSLPTGTRTVFMRIPFTITSLGIGGLHLGMQYDDGFLAYINGVPVADANSLEDPAWNSFATGLHPDSEAVNFQPFDASEATGALRIGENVLAIHGMNISSTSSDLLMGAELKAQFAEVSQPTTTGYMQIATAGSVNDNLFDGFAQDVIFSESHGIKENAFVLSLSSATPGSTIVYTTDGSTPAVDAALNPTNGLLFTTPFTIDETTVVRAAVFRANYVASYPRAQTYLFLDDVLTQSNDGVPPAGWPTGNVNGQELDFGMDSEIINLYGDQAVKDALSAISSFSITTDLDNLFGASDGNLRERRQWRSVLGTASLRRVDSAGRIDWIPSQCGVEDSRRIQSRRFQSQTCVPILFSRRVR